MQLSLTHASQQPTDFWLDTFTPADALAAPHLAASLATHSSRRTHQSPGGSCPANTISTLPPRPLLLLRVRAAASYFTTNATLMRRPPPVDADLILD
ncbi:MAG: hypothetical protein INR71_14140, partial [Terriglobus roseus]|nr:hypothetical protein [Terriglobus roseus]